VTGPRAELHLHWYGAIPPATVLELARRLHESGVPVTVNSDDPTMFATTLDDEIAALSGSLGLDATAAGEIVANGMRSGFDAGHAT